MYVCSNTHEKGLPPRTLVLPSICGEYYPRYQVNTTTSTVSIYLKGGLFSSVLPLVTPGVGLVTLAPSLPGRLVLRIAPLVAVARVVDLDADAMVCAAFLLGGASDCPTVGPSDALP